MPPRLRLLPPLAAALATGFALLWVARYVAGEPLPGVLADAGPWRRVLIYGHMLPGLAALAAAPLQLWLLRRTRLSPRQRTRHRWIGRAYVAGALASGGLAAAAGAVSYGGFAARLGFVTIAALVLVTTGMGWLRIRQAQVAAHIEWMIRSYALLLSFVTIRIWLATFPGGHADPETYAAAVWFSFVPNLIAAELYNGHRRASPGREYLGALIRSSAGGANGHHSR